MNYNHEDAVTIRTNGRKNDASALCALRDVLEGKALIYDWNQSPIIIPSYFTTQMDMLKSGENNNRAANLPGMCAV